LYIHNIPNQCWNRLTVYGENWKKFIKENTIQNKAIMSDPPDIIFELGVSTNFSRKRVDACEHWGSWITNNGWDCEAWEDNSVEFLTAWVPPIKYVINVSKKYPDLTFTLDFEEFSMNIWGTVFVKNGKELRRIEKHNEYMKRVHGKKSNNDELCGMMRSPIEIVGQMAAVLGNTPNDYF
jgi:hypothetical protein